MTRKVAAALSSTTRRKHWLGSIPTHSDISQTPITNEFVDGALQGNGAWAIMTIEEHEQYGRGLGTGFGQRYRWFTDPTQSAKPQFYLVQPEDLFRFPAEPR